MADQLVEPREADHTPHAVPDRNRSRNGRSARAQPSDASRWARWRERRRNRVSRWDRPPEPKDWRFFVGTLGKTLIATGLLMFGFVAYQLWGTGIETALAQRELADEFEDRLDEASTADEAGVGFDTWVVPDETQLDDTALAEAEAPDDQVGEPEADDAAGATAPGIGSAAPIGEASQTIPGGVDLSDYAVDQDVPVVPGESFARLEIDAIGVDEYLVPGVTLTDLKKGPGHYGNTPLPGQLGNASIAGHRTTYGAPFFDLDQLEPGDEITVTMVTGDRFVYRITGSEVVTAADTWVITTRDPTVAELTLTTCDPKYTARNRLVVHSVLVPERSSQVGEAEFYDLDEPSEADSDEPIPGDDPTFDTDAEADSAGSPTGNDVEADDAADQSDDDDEDAGQTDDAADSSDAAPDQSADDAPAAATDSDIAEPSGPADPAAATAPIDTDDAEIDAFSEGWFDDSGAWPQIALWGLVLILIAVGAYQLAKWRRNLMYAFLVGTVPFVVALYFFYQNVNRLLPPGL